MAGRLILAIETSCDDTCAAVLDGPRVLANVISSQAAAHEGFGGVVPEVASRHHLELTVPVVEAALAEAGVSLDDVEAVAVTAGPGLIGALLVGVSTAKAIAAPRRLPLIPVDHLQGHVAANFLEPEPLEPPFLCLVASGGHTLLAAVRDHDGHEVLGQTLDDAAGEAFDKAARMLGLGYPGGPALEKLAADGRPGGLRAAGGDEPRPGPRLQLQRPEDGARLPLPRAGRGRGAGARRRPRRLLPGGGGRPARRQAGAGARSGASGRRSRSAAASPPTGRCARRWRRSASERGLRLKLVARELCTDNAAMIGSAARFAEPLPYPDYLGYDAFASGETAAGA